jgi:hypothetical protein
MTRRTIITKRDMTAIQPADSGAQLIDQLDGDRLYLDDRQRRTGS